MNIFYATTKFDKAQRKNLRGKSNKILSLLSYNQNTI